jgi:hypothetical protein
MLIALFRRHGGDHVKFAALLSQRGSVSLPDETVRKLYHGDAIDNSERARLIDNIDTTNCCSPRSTWIRSRPMADAVVILPRGSRSTGARTSTS